MKPRLAFVLRDALLEYDIVDVELEGDYAGTMQVKSRLMLDIAKAVERSEQFEVDIEDRREEGWAGKVKAGKKAD